MGREEKKPAWEATGSTIVERKITIERFHSCDQHLCKFIATKERVYIKREFNFHRTGLEHQHGYRFIVLEHQYGRRDVM